jgi:hypothetical protein
VRLPLLAALCFAAMLTTHTHHAAPAFATGLPKLFDAAAKVDAESKTA